MPSGASAGGAASPNVLLSRSVEQVGRKSETTLGVAGRDEGSALTRQRVTDAVGWPKSAASAGRRQRRMAIPIVPDPSAAGRHGEPRDFCYDGAKAAVPQALLETDEDRLLIARLDIDHAIGHEPGLREGGGRTGPGA
jgi:hypothetical protein